jgi:hypothetical protein
MTNQPCPYKRIFRNVHIRRAFVIFGLPLVFPIVLIVAAAWGIKKNAPDIIHEAVQAFKDGNSYD